MPNPTTLIPLALSATYLLYILESGRLEPVLAPFVIALFLVAAAVVRRLLPEPAQYAMLTTVVTGIASFALIYEHHVGKNGVGVLAVIVLLGLLAVSIITLDEADDEPAASVAGPRLTAAVQTTANLATAARQNVSRAETRARKAEVRAARSASDAAAAQNERDRAHQLARRHETELHRLEQAMEAMRRNRTWTLGARLNKSSDHTFSDIYHAHATAAYEGPADCVAKVVSNTFDDHGYNKKGLTRLHIELRTYRALSKAADGPHAELVTRHFLPLLAYVEDTDVGVAYLVLPRMPGGTLTDLMRTPVRLGRACDVISQLLTGLDVMHTKLGLPLIHRDVKPDNTLLDGDGTIKLVDFGSVLPARETHREEYADGFDHVGSRTYAAPEIVDRSGAVDERTDLYSVGVIAHLWLTGTLARRPGADPTRINPEVPAALGAWVARMTARHPNTRPVSARQALDELTAARLDPAAADVFLLPAPDSPPAPPTGATRTPTEVLSRLPGPGTEPVTRPTDILDDPTALLSRTPEHDR